MLGAEVPHLGGLLDASEDVGVKAHLFESVPGEAGVEILKFDGVLSAGRPCHAELVEPRDGRLVGALDLSGVLDEHEEFADGRAVVELGEGEAADVR